MNRHIKARHCVHPLRRLCIGSLCRHRTHPRHQHHRHPFHLFLSFSLWLSSALSVIPYSTLNCSISFSVFSLNGTLPSKACRMIPSSRSPSVMSFCSATAFNTFKSRFSMRTPVCTRSTSTNSRSCFPAIRLVPMYQYTKINWPWFSDFLDPVPDSLLSVMVSKTHESSIRNPRGCSRSGELEFCCFSPCSVRGSLPQTS